MARKFTKYKKIRRPYKRTKINYNKEINVYDAEPFYNWLKRVYNMTYDDYLNLNDLQRTALHLQYKGF